MRFKEYIQEATYKREDMSKLPQPTLDEIKRLIREGAKNQEEQWANALELVHKAYEVANVERPSPDMNDAWKQYEEMLTLAVKELTKARGIDGDWRMSSHIFHEAAPAPKKKGAEQPTQFTISSDIDGLPLHCTVTADTLDEIIRPMYRFNITGHEIEVKHRSDSHAVVHFCKDGKRCGDSITIKKVPAPAEPKK